MKPLHSKPFNVEHAKAGAPIAFDDGMSAEIIKYDRIGQQSLVVLRGDIQSVCVKYSDGSGGREYLVMLPLGVIDGQPVFVGDALALRIDGDKRNAQPKDRDFSLFTWPAPAKAYPISTLSDDFLCAEFRSSPRQDGWRNVANLALRHAIDAGQVVIAADRDARDLAIADAVHGVCVRASTGAGSWAMVKSLDVRNIIATVPK